MPTLPVSGPITLLPLVSPNPYRGMDNTENSHTTNPKAASQSTVPVTDTGKPITSLRNRYHFPTAANLPHDDDIDENYFAMNPSWKAFLPKKHWAYLGEITAMNKLARLHLNTRDQSGIEIHVWFHLDHFGNGRPASPFRVFTPDSTVAASGMAVEDGVTLKVGHTFVMVYPQLRTFRDGTSGIRVDGDEKATFKVLPYSLDKILSANDTIVAQKLPNFTPVCQQCKTQIGGLQKLRCSKCHVAHYCNKECQVADWNSGTSANAQGHKILCKLYREVKWFTEMDWDNYVYRQGIRFQR